MNNIQKYLGRRNCTNVIVFIFFSFCIRIFLLENNSVNFYNINSFYDFAVLLIAGKVDISVDFYNNTINTNNEFH